MNIRHLRCEGFVARDGEMDDGGRRVGRSLRLIAEFEQAVFVTGDLVEGAGDLCCCVTFDASQVTMIL